MKKTILALSIVCASLAATKYNAAAVKRYAPKLAFVGLVASMKKKGLWDSASDEDKKFAEAQDAALQESFKDYLEIGKLDEKLKELSEKAVKGGEALSKEDVASFKDMLTGYKSMVEKIKKMEDEGFATGKKGNPIMLMLKENDELLKQFRKKEIKTLNLETKATQDTADVADHTIGFRVPGIGQLPVRKPFIMDIFRTVPVNLEFIKYMDQETVVRDAKNVAGIATSTHNTKVTWKERNIQITKVRDFIYLNQDMLADYDFVLGEVQNLLGSSVMLKADNGLLLDDGTYPNLHSIDEVSSEFDAANVVAPYAGTVQAPNIFDLAIAMASQIIALGKDNSYMPDTILWNTIDKYKSMLVKDKQDNYILPPFVVKVGNTEYSIDNMKVRSNPNVPLNSMYVFDSTKGTIYMRKGMGLEMAYNNNDDFEHEVVTMKAYLRMNLLIRNVDQNAFMKCSDVEAALTALSEPSI